jgi:hypothetical protein
VSTMPTGPRPVNAAPSPPSSGGFFPLIPTRRPSPGRNPGPSSAPRSFLNPFAGSHVSALATARPARRGRPAPLLDLTDAEALNVRLARLRLLAASDAHRLGRAVLAGVRHVLDLIDEFEDTGAVPGVLDELRAAGLLPARERGDDEFDEGALNTLRNLAGDLAGMRWPLEVMVGILDGQVLRGEFVPPAPKKPR